MDDFQFYRVARALADPTRFEIIEALAIVDELFCTEIKQRIKVAQPTISHHLKELANAQLVIDRREGQFVYYRLCRNVMLEYIAELQRRISRPSEAPPD
jgi:ArsR family transcriptional regulator, arsenate/arsenite/antimonite-responsive transcriptional repressor